MSPSLLETLGRLAMLPQAASLPSMMATLAQLERLSPAELERQQRARLAELVEHARRTVPRYANLPARFEDIPVLSRGTLREHAAALESREVPHEHRVVRVAHSSGSTGRPVTAKLGAVQDAINDVLSMRDHGWHGRDLTLKAASIRASPPTRSDAAWSPHPRGGPLVSLKIDTPLREQLAWLAREAPAYLATYASNAAGLVAEAERDGTRLPSLRELGTFGEALAPDLRERARRTFGVPIVDAYSSSEVGFIALQCPEHTHLHVQAESVFVELLRDDGTSCAVGETGRVVVTPLHAFAMPLLRYDLGDFATRGGRCPTGLGLPVLERVVGRVRNLIVLPNGDRMWPRFGTNTLGLVAPIRQFRLVQHEVRRVVLEIVSERLAPEVEARVRKLVADTLGYDLAVTLEYKSELARSPGGKFEECVSLLAAQSSR